MLEELKEIVCRQNLRLVDAGLVALTWGNVSGFDSNAKLVVIKPSGVDYGSMKPQDMVVVDLEGNVVEGGFRPSSDTPTHLEIYKAFGSVKGIAHTHSIEAASFAQAMREIPCYGTTHADVFHGVVPCTRQLTELEVCEAYERNTGKVIVERFKDLDPLELPGVLAAGHGPFTWGVSVEQAVDHAIALEAMAKMARLTEQVFAMRTAPFLPVYVGEKHYQRKHGANAYYGQNKGKEQ